MGSHADDIDSAARARIPMSALQPFQDPVRASASERRRAPAARMRLSPTPNTLWRLRGSTNKLIECWVSRTASKLHAITVVFGHETILSETYPDESSARRRAMQGRDGLLKVGGWTLVGPAPVSVSSR